MNQQKTGAFAFMGYAISLERAQRMNAPKDKSKTRLAGMSDDFIRPMWRDPAEVGRERRAKKGNITITE